MLAHVDFVTRTHARQCFLCPKTEMGNAACSSSFSLCLTTHCLLVVLCCRYFGPLLLPLFCFFWLQWLLCHFDAQVTHYVTSWQVTCCHAATFHVTGWQVGVEWACSSTQRCLINHLDAVCCLCCSCCFSVAFLFCLSRPFAVFARLRRGDPLHRSSE